MSQLNKDIWTVESDTKKLNGFLFVMFALGCLFIFLTKGQAEESLKHLYGYWVGVLLFLISVCLFLFHEETRVEVDESRGELKFHKKDRFGSKTYSRPFAEIESVKVVSIGNSHRGIETHHLIIQPKSGKWEAPGRFSTIQSEIIEEAERLAGAVGCRCEVKRKYRPTSSANIVIAAVGAILLYALWYRLTTGPWCQAMWFGTAPILIIGLSFLSIYRMSKRF